MEQNSLFQNDVQKDPLAARLRPASLQDYVGQKHLLGKGKILYNLIEKDMVSSMIFWGPPGVGKNDACQNHRQADTGTFYQFQCRHKRNP